MFGRRKHWRVTGRSVPLVGAGRGDRVEQRRSFRHNDRAEQRRTPLRGFPGRGKPAGA